MYGIADHKQLRHSKTLRHSTKHQYRDAITTQWFNHHGAIVHHDAWLNLATFMVPSSHAISVLRSGLLQKSPATCLQENYIVCQGVAEAN